MSPITNHFVIRVSDAKLCWIQVDDGQYRDITAALGAAAEGQEDGDWARALHRLVTASAA